MGGAALAMVTGIAAAAQVGDGTSWWPGPLLWGLCGIGAVVATWCGLRAAVGTQVGYRWWWQLLAVALEVLVVGLVVLFVKAPDLYPPYVPRSGEPPLTPEVAAVRDGARASSIASLRTAALAGLAGLAALGGLVVNAASTRIAQRTAQDTAQATREELRLTAQGQVTDRYARAIELLGEENLTVRLGGIYALARVARDSPDDQETVVEVLSAFVRLNLHAPPEAPGVSDGPEGHPGPRSTIAVRPDVLAAISVLGQLPSRVDGPRRADFTGLDFTGVRLSSARLAGTDLTGVRLGGADLSGANLINARLASTRLGGASLKDAVLARADLAGAELTNASLRAADLTGAHLAYAVLVNARLQGANLKGAKLRHADLAGVSLHEADLTVADLTGAGLADADLTGAVLTRADLTGADLGRADLRLADLRGANLTLAAVTVAQLESAEGDEATVLPEGVVRPVAWTHS